MTRQRNCTAPENVIPNGVFTGGVKVFCCGVCHEGFLSEEELAVHVGLPDLRAGGQTHKHLPTEERALARFGTFLWGLTWAQVTDFYQVKLPSERPSKPPVGTWLVRIEMISVGAEKPRWYDLDDVVEIAFPPRSRAGAIRATGLSEMNRIPIFPKKGGE